MNKTTTILLISIIIITFALFFRLYKLKLNELQTTENFQCKPKTQKSKHDGVLKEKMRIYVNRNNPVVKGGTLKLTPEHIPLMLEELKNMLSFFISSYCKLKVDLVSNTPRIESNIPVYNVKVTDMELGNEENKDVVETFSNPTNGDILVEGFSNPSNTSKTYSVPSIYNNRSSKKGRVYFTQYFHAGADLRNAELIFNWRGGGVMHARLHPYTNWITIFNKRPKPIRFGFSKILLPQAIRRVLDKPATLYLGYVLYRYPFISTWDARLYITPQNKNIQNIQNHKIYLQAVHNKVSTGNYNMWFRSGVFKAGTDFSSSSFKMNWKDQGHGNRHGRVYMRFNPGTNWIDVAGLAPHKWERTHVPFPDALRKVVDKPTRLELAYVVGGGGGHQLFINNAVIKIRKPSYVSIPPNDDLTINLVPINNKISSNYRHIWFISGLFEKGTNFTNARFKMNWKDQEWGNNRGIVYMRLNPGTTWIDVAVRSPHKWERVDVPFPEPMRIIINEPVRIELAYVVAGGGGHQLFIKDASINIPKKSPEVKSDFQSLIPVDDGKIDFFTKQIKSFCFKRDDCPYFIIDFDVEMSEKLASVLEHFSLNKMNDDAGTLELINAISLERGYNKVQTGLFKVLQLSKLFFFSRKYSEVDTSKLCEENN